MCSSPRCTLFMLSSLQPQRVHLLRQKDHEARGENEKHNDMDARQRLPRGSSTKGLCCITGIHAGFCLAGHCPCQVGSNRKARQDNLWSPSLHMACFALSSTHFATQDLLMQTGPSQGKRVASHQGGHAGERRSCAPMLEMPPMPRVEARQTYLREADARLLPPEHQDTRRRDEAARG